MTLQEAISAVIEGTHLSREQTQAVFEQIMSGQATDAQIGALLVALRMKGETGDEVAGAAAVMREKAVAIKAPAGCLDTCGTGGDGKSTFNISTAVAIVAAGAGICVAKHGNRSVSSKSGSADVLTALGVNIEADQATVESSIAKANVGFLFAPMMHGAMKYAIGPRKELAVRSIFNMLGPLTNPAGAPFQLLGTFSDQAQDLMADALCQLGSERAWLVRGLDGLDEITLCDKTRIVEVQNGSKKEFLLSPEDAGLSTVADADLAAEDSTQSAATILGILKGEITGPKLDIVLLNTGAALTVCGKTPDIKAGVEMARAAVVDGKALEALETMKQVCA